MSNEKMVMVTADTKDLLGMSPAAAEAILSNFRVQIELTGDVATPPGAQGKSLYPVHLDADQLQILMKCVQLAGEAHTSNCHQMVPSPYRGLVRRSAGSASAARNEKE